MEGIYPRGLSSISLTPTFPEINVRTYVHYDGKPGIFFMSLDVGDWASLTIAKRWYRLPYKKAAISIQKEGQTFYCQSVRKGKKSPDFISSKIYTLIGSVFSERRNARPLAHRTILPL